MSEGSNRLIVVGASHAGLSLVTTARKLGFDGPILLLGDEPDAPYQRPPLSKGFLLGKADAAALALKGDGFYRDLDVELRTDCLVVGIQPARRTIELASGAQLDYRWLGLATGAVCVLPPIPGLRACGALTLRTRRDAEHLLQRSGGARRVCIIGGGFIGMELAASLAMLGKQVTVVEATGHVMSRVLPRDVAEVFRSRHMAAGVNIVTGRSVRAVHGDADRAQAVELDDGCRVACDLVVAATGVRPRTELARSAGIEVGDGIRINRFGETSVPNIVAAGDCTSFQSPFHEQPGSWGRPESIQAANDLGRAAGSTVAGQPRAYVEVPWFWSDQFELKLQIAGMPGRFDHLIYRGDRASSRFSAFALREGRLAYVVSVNRPGDHMVARQLVAAGVRPDVNRLADAGTDLRSLVPKVLES